MKLPMRRRSSLATPSRLDAETFTTALGWFSLGLAALELAAPGKLARSLGLQKNHQFLKGFGARELATGAGLFGMRGRGRSLWIWARVAGDAMDIATLAPALGSSNPKRNAAIAAFGVVVAVTLIDVLCARALDEDS